MRDENSLSNKFDVAEARLPDFDGEVSDRLVWLRDTIGISVTTMAERTQISVPSINKYLRGESSPSLENIRRIVEGLGVEVEWLMFGRGSVRSTQHAQPIQTAESAGRELEQGLSVTEASATNQSIISSVVLDTALIKQLYNIESRDIRLVMVNDFAMAPTLNKGDVALINGGISGREVNAGVYLFSMESPSNPNKRIYQIRRMGAFVGGNIQVISDRDEHSKFVVGKESFANGDVMILGQVVTKLQLQNL